MSSQVPEEIKLFPQPGIGKVEKIITPIQPGRVKFQATYWPARLYNTEDEVTLFPEDSVTVIGRQGITLLVVPYSEVQKSNSPDQVANFSHLFRWTQKFGSIFGFRVN